MISDYWSYLVLVKRFKVKKINCESNNQSNKTNYINWPVNFYSSNIDLHVKSSLEESHIKLNVHLTKITRLYTSNEYISSTLLSVILTTCTFISNNLFVDDQSAV